MTDSLRLLDVWLAKARRAASLPDGARWPAWSTSELLAVALIVEDDDMLVSMDYDRTEALERLRHEIGEPNVLAAAAVFGVLRYKLLEGIDG
jgi:hypothetical protein